MPTLIDKIAEAIADKYAPAVNRDAPYAKIMMKQAAKAAIDTIIISVHHEAQDTEFDTGFEKFRSMLKENKTHEF